MATNAAMERKIKNRASDAFISISERKEFEPEPEVEPEPESEASDIRRKSKLMEELTKTLGGKAAVRSILSRPMEGYGCLLHHRRRLDKSILADVATLYCSVLASAAVHQYGQ
jgi:hypothetical protein